ncbi:MAG: hypothetical protein HRU18_11980 [Pseudoalteromonas sp.]|uniref:hypothetical protein n=1 Tax=Pseudoalteromonas sp. TaxID=53249 RepID=UPI001DEFC504|nr:hypothetical protein [Pseudoalteromonas sp.]NRA78920.1 hypothetical protein [Pseudoalteromonas sp.]
MKYTIQELKHLRNIRAVGFDDSFEDDEYGTEKGFFESETEKFFDWLEKMERRNRIKHMLATMNVD